MKKRLITGSIILAFTAIFLFTTRYTPYAFDVFIGMLAVMGCVEVSRVLERKKFYTNIVFIGCFPAILYIAMSVGIINQRDWTYLLGYFLFGLTGGKHDAVNKYVIQMSKKLPDKDQKSIISELKSILDDYENENLDRG